MFFNLERMNIKQDLKDQFENYITRTKSDFANFVEMAIQTDEVLTPPPIMTSRSFIQEAEKLEEKIEVASVNTFENPLKLNKKRSKSIDKTTKFKQEKFKNSKKSNKSHATLADTSIFNLNDNVSGDQCKYIDGILTEI